MLRLAQDLDGVGTVRLRAPIKGEQSGLVMTSEAEEIGVSHLLMPEHALERSGKRHR